VVDISRSRARSRAAKKFSSQALEADALHFSTDIWSSAVVLLGLACVRAAEWWNLPWLRHADAAAALGVAAIVVWISLRLGRRSIDDLLDGVPRGLHDAVLAAARRTPGVESVERLRLRRSGPQTFADLTLQVERDAALEHAHDVAHRVEDAVAALLPGADVTVHVEPAAGGEADATKVVRLLAARLGLAAHGVRIYHQRRRRWLELHLEVDGRLTLDEAHRQATEFERQLRESLPGVTRIVTHIEPVGEAAATFHGLPGDQATVQRAIDAFLAENPLPIKPHDLRVQRIGGETAVSFHCALEGATAITAAHDITVRLEDYLREKVPGLGRVSIHVEPNK